MIMVIVREVGNRQQNNNHFLSKPDVKFLFEGVCVCVCVSVVNYLGYCKMQLKEECSTFFVPFPFLDNL